MLILTRPLFTDERQDYNAYVGRAKRPNVQRGRQGMHLSDWRQPGALDLPYFHEYGITPLR